MATALFLLLTSSIHADIIYLQSGKVVFGKVTEKSQSSITIISKQGMEIRYFNDEILKIEKEGPAHVPVLLDPSPVEDIRKKSSNIKVIRYQPAIKSKTKDIKSSFKGISRSRRSSKIKFIPVSLFDGMDGSSYGFNQETFDKMQARADEVNLDLEPLLKKSCVYKQEDEKFFIAFYNNAKAIGCRRNYLIQRVLLEKEWTGADGSNSYESEYLVEIAKLNGKGFLKRADEHYKIYTLRGFDSRNTNVTMELGCGELPGIAEGKWWPFKKSKLYKRLQDYSSTPGLFDEVDFDFSNTFKFSFEFSREKRPTVHVPGYRCRQY